MISKKLTKKLAKLPTTPGVYFHKNAAGKIIYVGKAANLRNRVRQYFQNSRYRDPKTAILVEQIADVDWTELESEIDALVMEAELVRRYLPEFNILLRDDKSQQYVRIDYKSDYPTVGLVRRPLDDKAQYFGPYLNGLAIKKALRYLRRAFPYATAKQIGQKRPSLHYHLGLDPGLEGGRTSLADYRANLRKLIQYLKGERVALVRDIEREMKQAANVKDFEKAAKLRNQLFSLQALARQSLFGDHESIDISRDEALMQLSQVLGLYEQESQATHSDKMQGAAEHRSEPYQEYGEREAEAATQQLAEKPGRVSGFAGKQGRLLRRLRRIEGFDISHMSGTDTVASMVVFSSGLPDKAAYRKFKMIRTGNDDFAHMNEVITRRLREENRKKWPKADLILIDGGKGQLNAALTARDLAGQNQIPMVGLAKHEEEIIIHRTLSLPGVEEKYLTSQAIAAKAYVKQSQDFISILLPKDSTAVKLLQRIRDESHRFAVSYHSSLKRGRQTASILDEVPGVGPTTRKKLIRHFGSAKGVMQASEPELQSLLGSKTGSTLFNLLKAYR